MSDPGSPATVIVSPHLDDGVLSLGAAMASWAREGKRVELLTVFGCAPGSSALAGGWDSRAGFRTEGEAALARREEDARACARLGAAPTWLAFGDVDYDRHGDEHDVARAVLAAVEGADSVLLPGSPLSHPDHAWLVRTILREALPCRVGFYAEQPYSARSGEGVRAPDWVERELDVRLAFQPLTVGVRDRVAKWRAIREYRSQLPLLALNGSLRRGVPALTLRSEEIAWVGDRRRGHD